jgi:hypothetical protein
MSFGFGEMQLLCRRNVMALDSESLEYRQATEALFRNGDRFVLYLSDSAPCPCREERLIPMSLRQALLWLNENENDAGSFWG